jgi:hypothetical protein
MTNVSDIIVSRVLNRALMDLTKGTTRRLKHDDITAIVLDLEGFFLYLLEERS